jgi:hypothetical protein
MEFLQATTLKAMLNEAGITALVMHHERYGDTNFVELPVPAPWEIAAMPLLADRPLASWTDEEYEAWLDSTRPDMPEGDEEYELWAEQQDRMASKIHGIFENYYR